jgi:FMN phosphatase YigB (HAD superfamily)
MHFTLDVWNTLFIPNPHYATARNQLLANKLGIPEKKAATIYSNTKMKVDGLASEYGMALSSDSVYFELTLECIRVLNANPRLIEKALDGLEYEFKALFLNHQPHIWPETISTIHQLQYNHTFSIISNTNFMTGTMIKKVLNSKGLYFDSYMFSDIEGIAKPNPHMFKKALWRLNKHEGTDVVHIGDDPTCDNPKGIMKHVIIGHASELPNILKELVNE